VNIIRRPRSHLAQSDFFEPVIPQVEVGYSLFEIFFFLLQAGDFIGIGFSDGVTR